MPTTVKSAVWERHFPMPVGERSTSFVVPVTTVAASMGTNDVLKVCQILGKGITVYDAFVQSLDMDTNATPTVVFALQITDGTTTKTIISGSTAGQAGGFIRPTLLSSTEDGVGFTTTNKNFWIQLVFTTAAATAAAVAVKVGLTLSGYYAPGAVTE